MVFKSERPPDLRRITREGMRRYFHNSWEMTEMLFSSVLHPETTLLLRPDKLRNPLIFYFAHAAVFYVNKLHLVGLVTERINPHYEQIFAVGVDPGRAEDLETSPEWPDLDSVKEYKLSVFRLVSGVIDNLPVDATTGEMRVDAKSPYWALVMGCEHERIHFETSAALIRQLDVDLLAMPPEWPPYADPTAPPPPPAPRRLRVEPGRVTLGKGDDVMFGWDNEYRQLECDVAGFEIGQNLVTNGELREFVRAGGYSERRYWTDEGWAWRREEGATHPKLWVPVDRDRYLYRAMFHLLPLPVAWPAVVNGHEARAFLSWAGARLPSEAELKLVAQRGGATAAAGDNYGDDRFNNHLKFGSESPVGQGSQSSDEVNDVFGNVAEHVSDKHGALPGFEPHPLYPDFSLPFMDDMHHVVVGGSWASTGCTAGRAYRQWFRPHFFNFLGFRPAWHI